MPLTNRFGSTLDDESRRSQTTEAAAASALLEKNTRPGDVAAHIVLESVELRTTAATVPPERSPHSEEVSCVDGTPFPMMTKSPQPGWFPAVVNSGQFASSVAWSPPQSCVRHTLNSPRKIVPATNGSAMIGLSNAEVSATRGPEIT